MFTVFSKKRYLENGGEYPSFADECNGHVIDGDNSVRGTDYVLSAENVKRWCLGYEPKRGDKLVLNCVEWKESETVEFLGADSLYHDLIGVLRTGPTRSAYTCKTLTQLVERVVDFEKEEPTPVPEKKINISSRGKDARADVDGAIIFVKRYPNEQEEDMVCRLVKLALEELDGE